ncbi:MULTISPECIES: sulfate adenylyltransferase subunit 1 [unclassified Polaromonas]|uniref:sulfate adenylyltransferase subunit 1 n=1 Tax=unclassified Polaromonas TaxID=2638319 RepID=UPI0018CBCF27|nr:MULTISPECIES: GTP-binding protein [unclassified Polaromonas]MBG6072172.1 sulfate adenylyltransferase subunit 1 [Polaromonas sp. CG_9.7]MBG6114176.1 sulfate adenylyltransferase subunit 1 [Polaromonas sp. CG_9.2]MDH6184734.1 sulfate adenylyltransferase subunit 1 [Polaromonas sp. CG_23.6]
MTTIDLIADGEQPVSATGRNDLKSALKFITCGSVDDGKSTLIGRLLVDSKAVLQDHLAGVQRAGETDLALLTDGLSAEREQGITIDVAYRYFATESRKFIIGDAPGHEQYTRNMVTAASSADAAVVLVDATKLDWKNPAMELLQQTRRHSLLVNLLRVPSIVFAVNKLDAVEDATLAFNNISTALAAFAEAAKIPVRATVPVSALKGLNVVDGKPGWCGYEGLSLLALLEQLPSTPADTTEALAFPVQWVEKFSASADTSQGRRIFWGRVATGSLQAGQSVTILPSGQTAIVAQVLGHTRQPQSVMAGHSAGIVLDREVDVSRGDWLLAPDTFTPSREVSVTMAWMDDEPLVAGRVYWALQGHRWVKAKVKRIVHKLDVNTLAEEDARELPPNAIGHVELTFQEPLVTLPYLRSRVLGSLVLVDTASHKTSGAALVL